MSLHFQDEYLRHLLEDLTLSAARLVCVTVRPLDGGWALALARHLSGGFQLETLLSPSVFSAVSGRARGARRLGSTRAGGLLPGWFSGCG